MKRRIRNMRCTTKRALNDSVVDYHSKCDSGRSTKRAGDSLDDDRRKCSRPEKDSSDSSRRVNSSMAYDSGRSTKSEGHFLDDGGRRKCLSNYSSLDSLVKLLNKYDSYGSLASESSATGDRRKCLSTNYDSGNSLGS